MTDKVDNVRVIRATSVKELEDDINSTIKAIKRGMRCINVQHQTTKTESGSMLYTAILSFYDAGHVYISDDDDEMNDHD